MVKRENFKTCEQSGFCKRNRDYADNALLLGNSWSSPYRLSPESLNFKKGQLEGIILKQSAASDEPIRLPLSITFLKSGTARISIDEEKRQKREIDLRHGSLARKERYNDAASWSIVGGLEVNINAAYTLMKDGTSHVRYGPDSKFEAIVRSSPFEIEFKRDDKVELKLNGRGLMNVEHWRPKVETKAEEPKEGDQVSKTPAELEESTWWEETFGGSTDSKPRGPESIALDITFHGYSNVFGIPSHAGPLSLKETRGGDGNYNEPYRMYNSDVFEYEMDSPMTLYGSIPFMQAHKKDSTVGIFWLNAAETWVDIVKSKTSSNPLSLGIGERTDTETHWISESGVLDVFVFLGPTAKEVIKSYAELTGFSQLPQQFATAYHQCRWNYVTDQDVRDVDRRFDKFKIPYDVIWLDIEYTDHKKYFTFDPLTFPDPIGMQKQLEKRGRKLVTIIDPHIKNEGGYHIVDQLKSKDLAVKNKEGNIYEGWCWPGSSHWIDCFNPAAISWWVSLFKFDSFKGTTSNVFIWNDMNEPSVFNGPETTMPKDNLHHGNWEHRDLHNLNGMTFANATYNALLERKKGEIRRPFVLTRSFFAGSQRLGAMWTGDNLANWDHLAAGFPMILSQGIAGFPFAGADVGGFFGNPSIELLTRWYQAGAFYPFFRAHAHIDTRRREPYLASDPHRSIMTQAIRLRYQLLPTWYTAFHEASVDGSPIIRPQYYVFPGDEKGFAMDDQFYVGSSGLLAKPVVTEGASSVDIYISDEEVYYDYFDYTIHKGPGFKRIDAPLESIPLLMQGGNIISRRDRPRRSSSLMHWDPFTLVVVLGQSGDAEGSIYLDDGETFDYQFGAYIHRRFKYAKDSSVLTSEDILTKGTKTAAFLKRIKKVRVEKIIIVGAPHPWVNKGKVVVTEGAKTKKVSMTFYPAQLRKASWAVVRDPDVAIGSDWSIQFF
ncbi:MAG: hypothetical protein M1829_000261 [Trizodia sp. TS-e1964]|nr:MAG: hypothetical protein M1829_000261 [Trizodia sp. TS-e1964]